MRLAAACACCGKASQQSKTHPRFSNPHSKCEVVGLLKIQMFHVKRVKKRLISGNVAERSLLSCENVLLRRAKSAGCKRLEMFVARGAGVVTKNAALRLGGDCVGLWRAVCTATSVARVRIKGKRQEKCPKN